MSRPSLAHRSAADWAGRVALAALTGVVGVFCVASSLASPLRSRAPELAHNLAPWDGRITARLAERSFLIAAGTSKDRTAAVALARAAVRDDPTVVGAVATLGLEAQLQGDEQQADRLLAYSKRLSRRNLATQVWALERAKASGDPVAIVRQYDQMFRTSRTARTVYFPLLGASLADSGVRASLVQTLTRGPDWGGDFLASVAAAPADPLVAARFFQDLRAADVPVWSGASAGLINALLTKGQYETAWSYYASIRPSAVRSRSRDPEFAADLDPPSALDWVVLNNPGLSASIQPSGSSGVFDYSAAASVGGPVLRQAQVLAQGRYLLQGRSSGARQTADAQPYWSLSCADGRELGRVPLRSAEGSSVPFGGELVVPAGCPKQDLTLVVRPSSAMAGSSGQIQAVQIQPAK